MAGSQDQSTTRSPRLAITIAVTFGQQPHSWILLFRLLPPVWGQVPTNPAVYNTQHLGNSVVSDKSHSLPHCIASAMINCQGFPCMPTRYALETHWAGSEAGAATCHLGIGAHSVPLHVKRDQVPRMHGPAERVSQGSSGDFGVKPPDDIVKMGLAPWCSQETLTSTAQREDLSGDTIRGTGGHSRTCGQMNKQK